MLSTLTTFGFVTGHDFNCVPISPRLTQGDEDQSEVAFDSAAQAQTELILESA